MSNTSKAVADAAEQPEYAAASTRSAFFWRENTMPNAPDWPRTKGTPGPKAHGGPLLGSLSNKLYDVNGRRTVSLAPNYRNAISIDPNPAASLVRNQAIRKSLG